MNKRQMNRIFLALMIMMNSTNVFASVFGVVQNNGAVAYNSAGRQIYDLKKGEQLKVVDLQEEKDTYLIEYEGHTAEVDKASLNIRKVVTKITTEGTKVRKNPSSEAELLKVVSVGDTVNVLYQSGNWYYVVLEDQTEGFIYKEQLSDERLKLLPEKDFAPQKVEVLNWSTAAKVIPRGTVVTIQDVYTGRQFQVKRTFGTNHADVEALTTKDTQIIKSIWGGFSWERRPVIVHINGRYLAASMAGMPHAGNSLDAIKNNGMSGVLDLHFRGSRRHKEGNIQAVVDPLHQAAINVAANYKIK